jgi:hypothetical protein
VGLLWNGQDRPAEVRALSRPTSFIFMVKPVRQCSRHFVGYCRRRSPRNQRQAALDWIQCSYVGAGLGWEWVDGRVSGARTWLSCADLDRSLTRCLVVRLLHELTQTSLRADPQGLNTDRKRRRPAPSTAVCGPVPNLRETRASDRIGEGQLSDPA